MNLNRNFKNCLKIYHFLRLYRTLNKLINIFSIFFFFCFNIYIFNLKFEVRLLYRIIKIFIILFVGGHYRFLTSNMHL